MTTPPCSLDTWESGIETGKGDDGEQAGGPGTPWPGVAAGWHAMVDKLGVAARMSLS